MSSYDDFKKAFITLGDEIQVLAKDLGSQTKEFSSEASEYSVTQAKRALEVAKKALGEASNYVSKKSVEYDIKGVLESCLETAKDYSKDLGSKAQEVGSKVLDSTKNAIHEAAEYISNKTK